MKSSTRSKTTEKKKPGVGEIAIISAEIATDCFSLFKSIIYEYATTLMTITEAALPFKESVISDKSSNIRCPYLKYHHHC